MTDSAKPFALACVFVALIVADPQAAGGQEDAAKSTLECHSLWSVTAGMNASSLGREAGPGRGRLWFW